MKKILYVGNDIRYFFMHRHSLAIVAQAVGYDVHIALPDGDGAQRILEEGFAFHPISIARRRMGLFGELNSVSSLVQLYRSLRPDIVHHHTIKPVLYGGVAAQLSRVPAMVSSITGLGYVFLDKGLKATLLRGAVESVYRVALRHPNSRIVFQNFDDQQSFIERSLVRRERTTVIRGSGVNIDRLLPRPESAGMPTVVFVGRMLWDKGVQEYVDAAKCLKDSGVEARYLLIGDCDPCNPSSVPLSKLREWNSTGVVEWLGWRDDVSDLISQAHIICLPSYREGLPRVLIEACACGRAVVTTNVPGCREVVRHGVNGYLVDAKNFKQLAEALRRLIVDPVLRQQMGRRGRELAVAEFSERRVIEETLLVYEELLR